MSDDPPDQPKRWRGARRPPSRLATATTLVLTLGVHACSNESGGEADETLTERVSRPWFDTLPQIDRHPMHHASLEDGATDTGRQRSSDAVRRPQDDRTIPLPPVRVPAMPPPEARRPLAEARDPSWPDSVGRLIARRHDDPDRATIENYYLYLPPGFGSEDREWPVLLYLHGRSLRGDDIELVKRYGIPSLIARGHRFPFIVLAPQLPDGQHWVDMDRLWELLDEVVLEEYPVDEDRVYVTGFSMGGGGTWRFAVRHADRLAAAVPISATTPRPNDAWTDALDDLPMLVYHGDADALAPYEPAMRMVEHLREAGQEIELITLEGEGHGIVQDVYRNPALYEWLLAHER